MKTELKSKCCGVVVGTNELDKFVCTKCENPCECQTAQQSETPHAMELQSLDRQITDLQQELSQVRVELEKANMSLEWVHSAKTFNELNCKEQIDTLAKQNHKMRKALHEVANLVIADNKEVAERCILNLCDQALHRIDTTSIIVLTRAEVEKLPCGCVYRRTDGQMITKAVADSGRIALTIDKCPRCLLLERFTK